MARGAQELRCSCRLVWPVDRPCARPKATPWHRARHGFKREPAHGEQEMSVWNGHYACTCYHPLFVFNQFGDLERCALRAGNVHSADDWDDVLKPIVARYQGKILTHLFSSGRGLCNAQGLRVSGGGADQIRDPATGQPGSAEQDRLSAHAPSRTTSAPCV